MNNSRSSLGSSLSSLGGSSLVKNWTFDALRKEVHKILSQKSQALASFQDERIQELIEVRTTSN